MRKALAGILSVFLLTSSPVYAAQQQPVHGVTQTGQVIHVSVDGMVCDFCAQSIKKVLMKDPAVRKVDISLEKKQVTIATKPGKQLADKTIAKAIDYAGYDLVGIHRMAP